MFLRGVMSPPFPTQTALSQSSGLSQSHPPARLYFRLWRGEGTGAGSVLGLLTYFWAQARQPRRAGWARKPLAWPLPLGRGAGRPRPGLSEKSQALSLLLWWPSGGCGLFRELRKRKGAGSSQGLCQPASVPSTQLVEEHIDVLEYLGITLYK